MTAKRTRAGVPGTTGPEDGGDLLRELADALHEVRRGRFDVRLPRREGTAGEVVDQFNEMVGIQERRNRDLLRIGRVVGREGRMSDRLDEESYDGGWATGAQAVNSLIATWRGRPRRSRA